MTDSTILPLPSRGGGEFTSPHSLLGLDFANLGPEAAATWIATRPETAPFGYVVTPNADHFVRLARDPTLLPVYENAALRLLDSRVVAGVARLLGLRAPPVATGSDTAAALLSQHLRPGERITIVGLPSPAVAALAEKCRLVPPFHTNPPMGFEHDPAAFQAAVDFVLAHPARFIFLAVGSPRQERLAAAIAATGLATGTGLCFGAALEFLAGTKRRAPVWMQRAGLEWLARLIGDPRRLGRRYLIDCPAVFRLILTTSSPPVLSAGARPPPAGPRSRPPAFVRRAGRG
jgi:N-acetylglucosaminyldiphosphoundecaprenol N-acetyl-beta-D-mannosaminyltransferase